MASISAIEFGVAGGDGLVSLQADAAAVGRELGVAINVYGFDAGPAGLPRGTGDHRDHPDAWQSGDVPLNVEVLMKRLGPHTRLILGDVRDTVPLLFREHGAPPVGFVAIDLDLYSSTRDALRLFELPDRRMLRHVPMYFDDIDFLLNHRFAGELLAIDEFNEECETVKIDCWHGVRAGRPFPERAYLDKMFVAHDLERISSATLSRPPVQLPLNATSARRAWAASM